MYIFHAYACLDTDRTKDVRLRLLVNLSKCLELRNRRKQAKDWQRKAVMYSGLAVQLYLHSLLWCTAVSV